MIHYVLWGSWISLGLNFEFQVLSGDSIIIRGAPKREGPPPERQLNLASISAPRLARRPGGNVKM